MKCRKKTVEGINYSSPNKMIDDISVYMNSKQLHEDIYQVSLKYVWERKEKLLLSALYCLNALFYCVKSGCMK